jgi:hypothetical protein
VTAEIALMNGEALALAADSAVTLQHQGGQKIFTSANKIFELSAHEPVGVMVFGSAALMGVPWETLIKLYREKLGTSALPTVFGYAADFRTYLATFFDDSQERHYVLSTVYSYYSHILGLAETRVQDRIDEDGEITDRDLALLLSDLIDEHHALWRSSEVAGGGVPVAFRNRLLERYGDDFRGIASEVFEELPIAPEARHCLDDIAVWLFSRSPSSLTVPQFSGVVVAGFGESDVFPSLEAFSAEGVVLGWLKYNAMQKHEVAQSGAAVYPFAQAEMVRTFMEGVDPDYNVLVQTEVARVLREYPDLIEAELGALPEAERARIRAKLSDAGETAAAEWGSTVNQFRRTQYIEPVLTVMSILPKDELAQMAEALVNLTSFKRRVSTDAETVGGPVDVALISRGDGFIWIKRKLYFDASLNPRYFSRQKIKDGLT